MLKPTRRPIVSDPCAVLTEIAKSLHEVLDILERLEDRLTPVGDAETVVFYQLVNGKYTEVKDMFMKIDQFADLAVAFKDKLGNVAKVDGLPTWALTDDSLGKLDVAADGMSATFSPAGVGTLKVQVKADADLGSGVREIIGELDIEVSPLEAEIVELSATIR